MKLLYFAWVREKIGKSEESLDLPKDITNISDLANYLSKKDECYEDVFNLKNKINVAINQDHVDWDHPIKEGDELAFFPPVTGG